MWVEHVTNGNMSVLIFNDTTCLAADTPLSVRAQRWNPSLPKLSLCSSEITLAFHNACTRSSSIVGTPGFLFGAVRGWS